MTDPWDDVLLRRVWTGISPDPEVVFPVMPALAEEDHAKVVPVMSAVSTTAVLGMPLQTSWERMVLVMFGRALTRMI